MVTGILYTENLFADSLPKWRNIPTRIQSICHSKYLIINQNSESKLLGTSQYSTSLERK